MTQALVTPELLTWARERAALDLEVAAKRLGVDPSKLESWERGEGHPTFRQAETLAKRFYVPFGYLFLSAPPTERLPIPDLRTVAGEEPSSPSPDFYDLLNDVLQKQQWYREYQEDDGASPLPFVGRFALANHVEEISGDISNVLGINDDLRQHSASWEEFLRRFIRSAEDVGVLVLRSGIVGSNTRRKLSVNEFRGFAISDNLAPLVFINGQDAKAAQIFTLAHELAHLWLGESGVSNPDAGIRSSQQSNDIERLCNRTAAEVLLPREAFLLRWDAPASVETKVQTIATQFRVSTLVVLRQAYDLDLLTASNYWDQYQQQLEYQKGRESRGRENGGGNFYASLLARNSNRLTTALMAAVVEGRVLHRDAARLLSVKVKTLIGVSDRLFGEESVSG